MEDEVCYIRKLLISFLKLLSRESSIRKKFMYYKIIGYDSKALYEISGNNHDYNIVQKLLMENK